MTRVALGDPIRASAASACRDQDQPDHIQQRRRRATHSESLSACWIRSSQRRAQTVPDVGVPSSAYVSLLSVSRLASSVMTPLHTRILQLSSRPPLSFLSFKSLFCLEFQGCKGSWSSQRVGIQVHSSFLVSTYHVASPRLGRA